MRFWNTHFVSSVLREFHGHTICWVLVQEAGVDEIVLVAVGMAGGIVGMVHMFAAATVDTFVQAKVYTWGFSLKKVCC